MINLYKLDKSELEYTLHGIKLRLAKRPNTRAKHHLPVTPDILRMLKTTWDKDCHHSDSIMLWAASCTCFFRLPSLRRGDGTIYEGIQPRGSLSDGDVSLDSQSEPSVVRVFIKASKTDPFRKGV